MKETKKKKPFRLFDMNRDGKGVEKEDVGVNLSLFCFFGNSKIEMQKKFVRKRTSHYVRKEVY